jgi:hypothetical protein
MLPSEAQKPAKPVGLMLARYFLLPTRSEKMKMMKKNWRILCARPTFQSRTTTILGAWNARILLAFSSQDPGFETAEGMLRGP